MLSVMQQLKPKYNISRTSIRAEPMNVTTLGLTLFQDPEYTFAFPGRTKIGRANVFSCINNQRYGSSVARDQRNVKLVRTSLPPQARTASAFNKFLIIEYEQNHLRTPENECGAPFPGTKAQLPHEIGECQDVYQR